MSASPSTLFRSKAVGGAMLVGSAGLALAWANSPWAPAYQALLHTWPLHMAINDAVMVVFFLLVGLELRREIAGGRLAGAALVAPGLAALGGMLGPALVFLAFNRHDPGLLRGWAIPVATDIAFVLAVLGLLGRRVPPGLTVFLTALAVIDDLGAIIVIAVFYTAGLDGWALGAAALVWLALYGWGRSGGRRRRPFPLWPFLLGGVLLWALVFRSGVHATLAGVALAFAIPMDGTPHSPAARLEHALEPWVAVLVLPLFGLANAGFSVRDLPPGALTDPLTLGIAFGLLVGKPLGVLGALIAALRTGLARLPHGVTAVQLCGGALLCGIGFTMSLFIGGIAFRDGPHIGEVRLAVFGASVLCAALGLLVLWRRTPAHLVPPGPGT